MPCPTSKQPKPELPPAIVAEIATILARGYLKYRRSLAIPAVSAAEPPANRLSAAVRKPPVASRRSPRPRWMSPTVTRDSGNLRISRVGHPRYSRRHPLPALQKTKQRADASYISGSYPKGVSQGAPPPCPFHRRKRAPAGGGMK